MQKGSPGINVRFIDSARGYGVRNWNLATPPAAAAEESTVYVQLPVPHAVTSGGLWAAPLSPVPKFAVRRGYL